MDPRLIGTKDGKCVPERLRTACVARLTDATIVIAVETLYEPTAYTIECTIYEALGTNCASHDPILKLIGIAEPEQHL